MSYWHALEVFPSYHPIVGACLCVCSSNAQCQIANFNAGQSWVADQRVRPWQAIPCRILSALGAPSVKQRKISQNLCIVTSDPPQRDRVGWPSLMLLVFPEALSGWASQARCCEQLYYEQPYCFCRVAPTCAPYSCSLTSLQPYSQQQEEPLFQIYFPQTTHDFIVWAYNSYVVLMANYCHSTLAWLRDKVRGRHHRAYSLAWPRNKVRGGHHRALYVTAPGKP